VKAITFPVRSRSVLGFGQKGDRDPGTAVEKSVAKLDTNGRYLAFSRGGGSACRKSVHAKNTRGAALHFDLKLKQRQIASDTRLRHLYHEVGKK
jgi:hypothetical protein